MEENSISDETLDYYWLKEKNSLLILSYQYLTWWDKIKQWDFLVKIKQWDFLVKIKQW